MASLSNYSANSQYVVKAFSALFGSGVTGDLIASGDTILTADTSKTTLVNVLLNNSVVLNSFPLYGANITDTAFVGALLDNMTKGSGVDATTLTNWKAAVTAALPSYPSRAAAVATLIDAVTSYSGTDTSLIALKTVIDNRAEVGAYAAQNGATTFSTLSALQAQTASVDTTAASVTAAQTGSAQTGTTFTLTSGTDNVTGTSGNDTIVGDFASTTNASDQINGGAGTDTLKLYGTYDSTKMPVSLSGVEVLQFAKPGSGSIDASGIAGLKKVVIDDASEMTSKVITTGNGVALSLGTGVAGTQMTGANTWAASNTDTSATLNLTGYSFKAGATSQNLTITGTATTTLNISSTGNANKIATLTGPTATTAHVISGDKALTYATAAADSAALNSINASAMTDGGVKVDVSAGTTKAAFTFTGGAGNDTITFADNNLGTLTAGSQLDGGAGTADKLAIKDTALTTTEFAAINAAKNFEVLGINAALTLDASKLTSIKEFSVDADAIQTISNMATGDKVTLGAAHAAALTLSSATGVNDLGLVIGSASSTGLNNSGTLTIGQTQVSIASNGDGTGTNVLALANADNSSFTVTGSNDLNMGTLAGTSIGSKVDASAFTGKLTVTGSAKSDILIGGSGADSLDGGTITAGVTGTTAVKEVFTATLVTAADTKTIIFDGVTFTAAAGNGGTLNGATTAFVTAYNANGGANWVAVDNTGTVTFTAKVAGSKTHITAADFSGDANAGSEAASVTVNTQGVNAVTAVAASYDKFTGGAGADTFNFSSTDLDTAAGAVTAEITDFVTGVDKIKVTNAGSGAGSSTNFVKAAAAAADLATMLTAADTALTNTVLYYVGQVGSDAYLVTDADSGTNAGYTNVIKLTGLSLSGIAATDLIA